MDGLFQRPVRTSWRSLDDLLETKRIDFQGLGLVSASVIRSVAELAKRRAIPACIPLHQVLVDPDDHHKRTYLACAHCAHVPDGKGDSVDIVMQALQTYFKAVETRKSRKFLLRDETIEQWLGRTPADLDEMADWLDCLADWVTSAAGVSPSILYVDSANVLRQRYPSPLRWGRLTRGLAAHLFPNVPVSAIRIVVARRPGDRARNPEFFKSLKATPTVMLLPERGTHAGDQADDVELATQMKKDLDLGNVAQAIFLSNDGKFWTEHMAGWKSDRRVGWARLSDPEIKKILDEESD